MHKLVSILIPCFNAERWIASAIDSCLAQTYPAIEIVVVDDGSTDRSVEIIQQYGDRVLLKPTPHHGGNHARNVAFTLCQGEYIQYLDADDYLFPEKIARQVQFLEETGADVVYGDWRRLYHSDQNHASWGEIQISGEPAQLSEKLLSNSWWVAVAALLYRRECVEKVGGWDEQLLAAQDRDFFLRIVLQGAQIVYQPGCYAVYRYYGDTTVSTASRLRWLESHIMVTGKAEAILVQSGQFDGSRRNSVIQNYFLVAREMLHYDFQYYLRLIKKMLSLNPQFDFYSKRSSYKIAQTLLGFERAEQFAGLAFLIQGKLHQIHTILTQWLQSQRSIWTTVKLPTLQSSALPKLQNSSPYGFSKTANAPLESSRLESLNLEKE